MRKIPLSIVVVLLAFSSFVRAQTPSPPKPSPETGFEGVISAGPVRGGPTRQGVPDTKPLPNIEFLVEKQNVTVGSFKTDDQGRFRILLPAGHYAVSRKDWKAAIGSYGPFEVEVAAGQMKRVEWTCDTGIR